MQKTEESLGPLLASSFSRETRLAKTRARRRRKQIRAGKAFRRVILRVVVGLIYVGTVSKISYESQYNECDELRYVRICAT